MLVRFDGYRGRYVFHCHNLEHEDMMMMANFEVVSGVSPEAELPSRSDTWIHRCARTGHNTRPASIIPWERTVAKTHKVTFKKSGITIDVAEDEYILEEAEDAGLHLPYDCRSGTCTTCIQKCLEGEIDQDMAFAIGDEELERPAPHLHRKSLLRRGARRLNDFCRAPPPSVLQLRRAGLGCYLPSSRRFSHRM